jgi:hypothetical protein
VMGDVSSARLTALEDMMAGRKSRTVADWEF